MDTQLLATKLFVPKPRSGLVSRPRLIEFLNNAVNSNFVLVSAPAGFGKTTILTQWVSSLDHEMPVAWIQLDESDNDPVRFWDYFIAAVKTLLPGIDESAINMLHSSQTYSIEAILTTIINSIVDGHEQLVVIFDDYHLIRNETIHAAIAYLVNNCPPMMHLVIATRTDPKLPLSHFRGRDILVEIGSDDLRFTTQEAADLIKAQGINLDRENIAALNIKAEGWAIGLKMAALAMRGKEETAQFVTAFTGSQRFIMDYLVEEVLANQPEDVRSFLLDTSVLKRMTASLCDFVTGRNHGGSILVYLERSNLFTVRLDDIREWYRYHHLFGELLYFQLEKTFGEKKVSELHQLASQWFEEHGFINDAVYHSIKARDWPTAIRLIDESADGSLFKGELSTLLAWCQAIPDKLLRNNARLYVRYARVLLYMGQVDEAEVVLTYLEKSLTSLNDLLGEVATLQADIARRQEDVSKAIEQANKALRLLSESNLAYRAEAGNILGTILYSIGEFDKAWTQFQENYELARQCGNLLLAVEGLAYLAYIQVHKGKLQNALELCEKAKKLGNNSPAVGLAWHISAIVKYEQNNLEGAIHDQEIANKFFDLMGRIELKPQGHVLLATYLLSYGDTKRALAEIAEVNEWISSTNIRPGIRGYLDIWLGILAFRMNDNETLLKCVNNLSVSNEMLNLDGRHVAAMLLIATGDKIAAAILLKDIVAQAERANVPGLVATIQLYQALAADSQEDGIFFLWKALRVGQSGGYIRTFVDEGKFLEPLLRKALKQNICAEYTAKLINIIEQEKRKKVLIGGIPLTHQAGLLSNRELEILKLLETGLSNRQISERLIISSNTTKRHISNIFQKLNAKTRTQAIARAREIKLI